MINEFEIEQIASHMYGIEYDWWQIVCGKYSVGCIKGLSDGPSVTINSIIIYPEYKGKGYDAEVVRSLQKTFKTIISDNTHFRKSAFWKQLGFHQDESGRYEWNAE